MKVIIAGSRDLSLSAHRLTQIINLADFSPTEIVSGTARGIDRSGEAWARTVGISIKEFPADWDKYGNMAGPIRNRQMANYADALIAVWDGKSRGTKHMIDTMKKLKKPVFVWIPDDTKT